MVRVFSACWAFSNNLRAQWGTVSAVAYNSSEINLTFGTAYKSFYNIQLTSEGKNHYVDTTCYEEKTLTGIRVIGGNQGGANKGAEVQWLAIGY